MNERYAADVVSVETHAEDHQVPVADQEGITISFTNLSIEF